MTGEEHSQHIEGTTNMGRRRTGGIDDRGNGRRYARITVTLENGKTKRQRIRIDPKAPVREARRTARDYSREAESFVFPVNSTAAAAGPTITVDDFHKAWAAERERRGRRSEQGRYTSHVKPLFGAKAITTLSKDDARALAAALDDKVTAGELHWSTATKVWGVVKKMFRDAVESKVAALRVLESSPFEGVQGPDRGDRKGKQWLFPSEVFALLACADLPLRWRRLYALGVYLYLRPGELAALEWQDVHLEHGFVYVHQALDLRSGATKATKTGITRRVPIGLELRPLLLAMKAEAGGRGRVVQHTHENKKAEHGMPPLEDLAATLREHLDRAGVERADLFADRPTTKKVTFYDLRATGITWEALAGTELLAIMQRAGHRESKTTLGYVREADSVGLGAGRPFPPLPACTISATHIGHIEATRVQRRESHSEFAASPTGFEPVLQP
jgi:integrase